jgi:aspartokinase-like uncharacterized kinase
MSLGAAAAAVEIVVKVGGGVLADLDAFDGVLAALGDPIRSRRLLIVPGGGPFADAVREVDRRLGLPDDAAHWMAVLAMDQYAHLIAARLSGAALVAERNEIAAAIEAGRTPVLAPSRWLRAEDPLPHSWDVTSDSIAAWIAGRVGARRLVLVKPAGAAVCEESVDRFFPRALPTGIDASIVAANQIDALSAAL